MRRWILLIICFSMLLAPIANAAIGSKGLTVNGGVTEITLKKGEKRWLYVQDGLSKLPLLKGVSFYSDNTVIFTAGLHSGVIRGNSIGRAKLTVISKQGHCAYITVTVVPKEKTDKNWLFLLFVGIILLALYIKFPVPE